MTGKRRSFVGIDVGTSGVRAVAIDEDGAIVGQGAARHATFGSNHRDPHVWWQAVTAALRSLADAVPIESVHAISVGGTSGTALAIDGEGTPLATPLMYNDAIGDGGILDRVKQAAPAESAAHGPTSGLAKALTLQTVPAVARIIHQADWVAGRLCGRFDVSDENNALKTGYDPVARRWPDWIGETAIRRELLPQVVAPGTPIGRVTRGAAAAFGFPQDTLLVAGTTDGCASFLATGASAIGDGVTALGSTLTVKLLSDRPIFAPDYGIYSHRLLGMWLAGGASNTGGAVLAQHFPEDEIVTLSAALDPETPTGLDYYPLAADGERFPTNDPAMKPRLEPRPADRALFLQAMLEGIASVESLGYRRLQELGAPALRAVRSVGGGARNAAWSRIRTARLGVSLETPRSEEAAAGAARLALLGVTEATPA